MEVGLDVEALDFTLESIGEFAKRELPDSSLIELDEKDEFPEELVRRMCGDELGIQLLFIPEEFGGRAARRLTSTASARAWPRST